MSCALGEPSSESPHGTTVRVSLHARTDLITTLREFAFALTNNVLGDVDMGSRIALALHELLENTLKYSVDGMAGVVIELSAPNEAPCVTVTVTNRTDEGRADELREALAELAAAPDASAFYQKVMRRGAARVTGSGLGLARIWAEGDMTLKGDIVGGVVSIIAQARGKSA